MHYIYVNGSDKWVIKGPWQNKNYFGLKPLFFFCHHTVFWGLCSHKGSVFLALSVPDRLLLFGKAGAELFITGTFETNNTGEWTRDLCG